MATSKADIKIVNITMTSTSSMTTSTKPTPPTPKQLHHLFQQGALPRQAYYQALDMIRPDDYWLRWAERHLMLIGSILLLAGIMFFFAYNWQELHRFGKLGLLEVGVTLTALLSLVSRFSLAARQVLLTSAVVLTGILFAVFGQIYQTGADAYTLFLSWAVVTLPWVALARLPAPWAIWFVVSEVACWLVWEQVLSIQFTDWSDLRWVSMALLAGFILLINYKQARTSVLASKFHWLYVTVMLGVMAIPALKIAIDDYHVTSQTWGVAITWLVLSCILIVFYRFISQQIYGLTITSLQLTVVLLVWLLHQVSDMRLTDTSTLFIFGLLIVTTISLLVFILRSQAQLMRKEAKE
ncbi:DUF2157 domain-containing protein [Zooshikella marina]|uniref:DUF2157 domain-containing protein n=1 Tax=Zooshikella ganghwensis TaxID=202772 RepID=UPI001BAEF0D5|nr:DUF2157 domain-containing protein [Zooshikella ganghwensis]MBU2704511.1 DUF2157 domain-containing protein [Zooshikella ganghwensis]